MKKISKCPFMALALGSHAVEGGFLGAIKPEGVEFFRAPYSG